MFTPSEREQLRGQLLDRARSDERIAGAALTGSAAAGNEDRWSDVDIFLGVSEDADLAEVMCDWTGALYDESDAVHHWDVLSGAAVYRVFLLGNCLHVDVAFTPVSDFGARGPSFRVLFGDPVTAAPTPPPALGDVVGLGWLGVLHAHAAIERRKLWEAAYWIGSVRNQTLSLACLRLGETPAYARGADRLPPDVTAPLENTFVRKLERNELRRALRAAAGGLLGEVRSADRALADRLDRPLLELVGG